MPWFITSVCSDEALEELRHENINPDYPRPQRTFGFFDRYHEAFLAVKDNTGNMQECVYDYLILEYIEPGIHPKVYSSEWYRWDYEKRYWATTECPEEFKYITNFALG